MTPIPNNEKGLALIMMGIPGSGKSTFVMQQLSFARRINMDTLRTRAKERKLLQDCMDAFDSFVVDNTNPTKAARAPYLKAAKDSGYQTIGFYMQSAIQPCMERNAKREGKACVPGHVLAHISRILELPDYPEGFDRLYYVRILDDAFIIEDWRDDHEI